MQGFGTNFGFNAQATPATGFSFKLGGAQPAPAQQTSFGAPQQTAFGAPQQSTFGAQQQGTFGTQQAGFAFGGTNQATTQQNTTAQQTTTFGFGNNPQTTAFNGFNAFGAANQQQQNNNNNNNAQQQQQQSQTTFDTLLGDFQGEELTLLKQLKQQITNNETNIGKITESLQKCATGRDKLVFQLQSLKKRGLEAAIQTKSQAVQLKKLYDRHIQQRQCIAAQSFENYVSTTLFGQLKEAIASLNLKNATLQSQVCHQNDIAVLAEHLKAIQAIEAAV